MRGRIDIMSWDNHEILCVHERGVLDKAQDKGQMTIA